MTQGIVPPFTGETALAKVQVAEDLWNARDPERIVLAYTEDSEWRNRSEFLKGRKEIRAFLQRKWARELDYRLKTASAKLSPAIPSWGPPLCESR